MSTRVPGIESSGETGRGIVRWAGQMVGALVVFGAILFLSAGRLDWAVGWAYLGLNAITQALSSAILIPRQPDMLAGRSGAQRGTKDWDRYLAPAITVAGTLAVIVTAGLDARLGWSAPRGNGVWVVGLALAFGSQLFVLWAMASNPFFATTVRIQGERGHHAVRGGPYRLVRHPGYLGSAIYTLVVPLVLGSLWTYIPSVITVLLLVVRTGLEDRTLQAELPGYAEYTAAVRYRLVPGVW